MKFLLIVLAFALIVIFLLIMKGYRKISIKVLNLVSVKAEK
jgi:hypothetical protein